MEQLSWTSVETSTEDLKEACEILREIAVFHRPDGTTNPLTCSKCGRLIERGAAMQWRKTAPGVRISEFWHTGCNRATRNGRKAK